MDDLDKAIQKLDRLAIPKTRNKRKPSKQSREMLEEMRAAGRSGNPLYKRYK